MQQFNSFTKVLAALTAIASAITIASSFSFNRMIQDVDQDIDSDSYSSSQDIKISMQDLSSDEPAKNHQKGRLDKYVSFKERPTNQVTVMRGHRLELKCEVDGNPPPSVYWIRGENAGKELKELEHESYGAVHYTSVAREISKYVIQCAEAEDETIVRCVGVSGDKILFSEPTIIKVIEPNTTHHRSSCQTDSFQSPIITKHRSLYISEIGSSVILPCQAIGNPKPEVYWVDGSNAKLSEPRFTVQPNGALVIGDLRWQDMDNYKCVAESDVGRSEAVTFVYPAAKSSGSSGKRKPNIL